MNEIVHYNFFDKILFTCYALVMYLWKLAVPVSLSCCYDYPIKLKSIMFSGAHTYPFIFYISPLLIAATAFLIYHSKRYGKDILFGSGFFLINIALVLPGLASRNSIIADRYTYISYIGLFFIPARWLSRLWQNKSGELQTLKIPFLIIFVLFFAWCGYVAVQRCSVWRDSITLWSDAIIFDPNCVLAYDHRGRAYQDMGKNNEALKDYNVSILLLPDNPSSYYDRGLTNYNLGQYYDAINDYSTAIHLKPDKAETYNNRGNAYCALAKYNDGINDFSKAILLKPNYTNAYNNRGNAYCCLKEYDEGIRDYDSAILIEPNNPDAYRNRAITNFNTQKPELAMQDAVKVKQLGDSIGPSLIEMIQASIDKEFKEPR